MSRLECQIWDPPDVDLPGGLMSVETAIAVNLVSPSDCMEGLSAVVHTLLKVNHHLAFSSADSTRSYIYRRGKVCLQSRRSQMRHTTALPIAQHSAHIPTG